MKKKGERMTEWMNESYEERDEKIARRDESRVDFLTLMG